MTSESVESGLTPKQKVFCEEYLIDLNGTQAAIRAGYSEDSAKEIASQNLTKLNIRSYIEQLKLDRSKRTTITADRVLKEIAKLAFFNMDNVLDEDGKTKDLKDWTRDDLAAVQEITEDNLKSEENTVMLRRKVKLSDKKSSLELLGKHLKLFTEVREIKGNIGITDLSEDELDRKIQQLENEHEQSTED